MSWAIIQALAKKKKKKRKKKSFQGIFFLSQCGKIKYQLNNVKYKVESKQHASE